LAHLTGWSLAELLDLTIDDFRDWQEASEPVYKSLLSLL
jgi:hypothetical protein